MHITFRGILVVYLYNTTTYVMYMTSNPDSGTGKIGQTGFLLVLHKCELI